MTGSNGAKFYLDVTSRLDNDLGACADGTPLQGPLGHLMDDAQFGPHVDRRCVIDPAADPTTNALIGVYSPGTVASKEAAREYCGEHYGTNPQ
ncbi:hypothetical protein [Gordonia sp. MP11Mi]|uniref:Uncharacterized protein n=1 Tax=Gordonia sp. MP11Mi TaxID=3022769 RepID=A0AA97GV08_9ACTN